MTRFLTCSFLLTTFCFIGWSTSEHIQTDAYKMMSEVFVGNPTKEKIQPMLESVMKRYNLPVNRDNLLKAASVLLELRKSSAVGVTEMEILKHMYQKGTKSSTFPNQAALSATLLEIEK